MSPTSMDMATVPHNQPRHARLHRFAGILVRGAMPLSILVIGFCAYFYLSKQYEKEQEPPAKPQLLRTEVTELRVRDYQVVVRTHGFIQPHNQVTLSARVSGQVIHVSPAFEAGSYFSAGELLVELEAKDYQTAVAMATAQLHGSKSALQLATLNEERKQRLRESNAVSQAELEQAKATREQAEATLESAEAQLQQAELDLARTKVFAPFAGRVREKNVGIGQMVSPATPLGEVFAVDYAEVRLPISAEELQYLELPEVAEDKPLDVQLRDAISQTSKTVWQAKIVRTEGVLDEDSIELFAIARMDDPFGLESGYPPLRIGQPVVASIAGRVLNNVVALPRVAVRQLDLVNLVDPLDQTLMPRTIDPIWQDEEYVIVRDPDIQDGVLLSTTHLVYAPAGTKVEIIAAVDSGAPATEVAKSQSQGEGTTN